MNQIWQYWSQGLTSLQCDQLVSLGNKLPVAKTGLGFDGEYQDPSFRSSEIRWFDPRPMHNRELLDILWYFANEANKNAFGFDLTYLNEIQYTTYYGSDNGKYDWHIDTFWGNPTVYDRKLSMVIQLSDPNEYEGGDFQIDPDHPQLPADVIRNKGAVIVFPSFLRHRVTPVISGVRRSLVTWIQGPKFR